MFLLNAAVSVMVVDACSRLVYSSKGNYYTARSLDWFENPQTDIWALPAGMEKDGGMGEGSIEWESKYGSVVASTYGLAGLDGMNEMGLSCNMLYLTETDTGADDPARAGQPILSIGGWLQFILDNFADVAEAVDYFKNDTIIIATPPLPMGKAATTHVSLSDATGDSAVFEYLEGKLMIHHSKEYNVMTNSPRFEEQLAIAKYWDLIGGLKFLPGTHTAADRYVRLNYNVNAVPESKTREVALATALSLIRHISVPFGITDPVYPNLASTYSRQVYDHTERIFYFEDSQSPTTFFFELNHLDLTKGSGIRKLSYWGRWLTGEVSHEFIPADAPYEFLAPKHTDGSATPPEYGNEKPRCIRRNTSIKSTTQVGSKTRQASVERCNDECYTAGSDAFAFNTKTRRCVCLNESTKKRSKLVYQAGITFGYTTEYFSDAACAGRVLKKK